MDNPAVDGSAEKAAQEGIARETHASILSGMHLSKEDVRRQESRARFDAKYRQFLFDFFKSKGVKHHNAEDLAGDLIAKLLERMNKFQYDPSKSFRSYLHTVAQHAVGAFWKKLARGPRIEEGFVFEELLAPPAVQQCLEEQFHRDLLEEAVKRVRERKKVSDRDWQIYTELIQRLSTPDELASRFQMKRNAVDNAKRRVVTRIKAQLRTLEQHGPEES